ncbi:MAG TPA: thioredoxin-dependent thiol peroxidase [Candidatus Binataceae bacterium]|nr:thioredoxin-dependent thiol peroxidase [Candidatus Binataceae bacterium]
MPTRKKSPAKKPSAPKKSASRKTPAKAPAPTRAAPAGASALEGKKAPDFELPAAGGERVALHDLIGAHNLVLYFYPRDMTPGCTTEACSFRDNLADVRGLGAEVAGVSADSAASHAKFRDKYALNFPLLSDEGNKVGRLYGVYKMKSQYGRQFMGIERTTFVIDRAGVIRKVFPKVKVAGHTAQVIDALRQLA